MVARPGAPYRSANAGEISPAGAGRIDVKQYYSAGLRFKNIEPVPLSGFRQMAGSIDYGPARSTPNVLGRSGVSATPGPFTGTQTIWTCTLSGAPMAIDFSNAVSSTGIHTLQAQIFRSGAWQNFGGPIDVGTDGQALTIAIAPGSSLAATQMRVRCTFSASASVNLGTVTILTETAEFEIPRYWHLQHDSGSQYHLSLTSTFLDVYEGDAFVAGVYLPDVTSIIARQINFYAENGTIGLFHRNLKSQRVRRSESSFKWVRDFWPYDGLPKVDLGSTYTKTADKWLVSIPYSGDAADVWVRIAFTVNGEDTPALPFLNASNNATTVQNVNIPNTIASIKAALEALPSLGPTVNVTMINAGGKNFEITITFTGALSGDEYELDAIITSTPAASALASHTEIGKTDFEDLFSNARGWPGVTGLLQDRIIYADVKAVPSALAFSAAGEYFKLDITAAGDAAPRLDKLRGGQAAERVLAVYEATYPLVFTDRAVHFVSNRAIKATEPINYVHVSNSGIVANCPPADVENKIFYIGRDPDDNKPGGHELLSLSYSEIETNYDAVPEHVFASHLVSGITRLTTQKSATDDFHSKLWMMRSDGRLIAGCVIKSQEVTGFVEWVLASNGLAKEIHVDAANDLRMCVSRGGTLRHERLTRDTVLQAEIAATADLSGRITGLDLFEGLDVWVTQDDYFEGPFRVSSGAVTVGAPYTGALRVGLWRPPLFEGMPRFFVTRNDEVIQRPGRIALATLELIDTNSVAVGANSQPIEDVPLLTPETTRDEAPPLFTGKATRAGMLGAVAGTTLVISQVRPGALHVRDIVMQEKL